MIHIFLCCNEKNSKCCPIDESLEVFNYLKERIKDLGLNKDKLVLRSRANCLQVCKNGPVAVVYPHGTWYNNVDKKMVEKILEEHVIK